MLTLHAWCIYMQADDDKHRLCTGIYIIIIIILTKMLYTVH